MQTHRKPPPGACTIRASDLSPEIKAEIAARVESLAKRAADRLPLFPERREREPASAPRCHAAARVHRPRCPGRVVDEGEGGQS